MYVELCLIPGCNWDEGKVGNWELWVYVELGRSQDVLGMKVQLGTGSYGCICQTGPDPRMYH